MHDRRTQTTETTATQDDAKPDFSYFDHDADIGIVGRGATVERAFEASAAGMFAIMAGSGNAAITKHVEVAFIEPDIELALVTWLNLLLAEARAQNAALFDFHLERGPAGHWHGTAEGCSMRQAHDIGVEVKGATLTELSVRSNARGTEARCVVDV